MTPERRLQSLKDQGRTIIACFPPYPPAGRSRFSATQFAQQRKMAEATGVPSVMIDVDHADVRKYSKENTFTRLGALIEAIDMKRSGRLAM